MGPFSRFQFERVSVPRAYCGELLAGCVLNLSLQQEAICDNPED
jgi:hypothetical protein